MKWAIIFDSAGWLALVTMEAKIIIQDLRRANLKWDDTVPGHISTDHVQGPVACKSPLG